MEEMRVVGIDQVRRAADDGSCCCKGSMVTVDRELKEGLYDRALGVIGGVEFALAEIRAESGRKSTRVY